MDESAIRDEYMMLGSDHKRKIKKTHIFGRLPIGNKGIGKLAGLGIAKKITIITTKNGFKYRYEIDRDEIEKAKTLETAYHNLNAEKSNGKASGTTIELTKILSHVKIDIKELRGHLAREIPQDSNFQIFVNDEKCLRKDIPAKRKIPVDINDEICGKIIGEIIVAKKALTIINPGIFTTVRGRVVGPPSLFDVTKQASRYRQVFVQFITGTVEVASFEPEDKQNEIPVIKTDREGFNEDHPKYKKYRKIMTDLLNQICREEETEFEQKRDKEKQTKVQESLKNIIDDFNAYDKEKKQKIGKKSEAKANAKINGKTDIFVKSDEKLKDTKGPDEKERTNPVGISDKRLREELKAFKGEGSINLGNKRYKITLKPLGEDDYECAIDDEASVININVSHPAYDQAVMEKCVEITVFRAIAAAFAWKESKVPDELYGKLDEMIRFQADRMNQRRTKRQKRKSSVDIEI